MAGRWIAVIVAIAAALAVATPIPSARERTAGPPVQVTVSIGADGASVRIVQDRFVLAIKI